MKKLLRLLALTAVVALSLCATALAADPDAPAVLVNGQAVEFADAAPQIVDGRTYIPLRATFTALGFADEDITWDGETRTATAVKDGLTITLTEGEKSVTVTRDGESETLETDAAAYVDAATGRTLVPLRFVAQAAGCNVGWDGNTRTAIIDDTAAILAANTETYTLMDRYMAYSNSFAERNYKVTGDFSMDMTAEGENIAVAGAYEMLTDATKADFTTNMAFSGQAEGQDVAALFPEGLDLEMRFDMETGVYYLRSDALNEAAQIGVQDVWYRMDLSAILDMGGMMEQVYGMDYQTLMEQAQAARDLTFTEYLEQLLSDLPLTDATATTSDVLAVINDLCADSAFVQSGAAYTSTYALGEGAELVLTLYTSGGRVNGYAVQLSAEGVLDVSATMRGNDLTAHVAMNVPSGGAGSAMSMTMDMTGRYASTTAAPKGVPPTGAGVMDLTSMITGPEDMEPAGSADAEAQG